MTDLSALMPILLASGIVFLNILAFAAIFKTYYKKVNPGEVMILNTLASDPMIIRTGALVYPIIYSYSKLSFNTIPLEMQPELITQINEKYGINYSKINVQLIDKNDCILNAHKRINSSDPDKQNIQLRSIVSELVIDALNTENDYASFKNSVNQRLASIGYEMINS